MLNLWAKTGREASYLPLAPHLHDVGRVAERLWDVALTRRQRRWLAAGLGLSEMKTRDLVTYLAAAHDVGKATPTFQRLVPELADRLSGRLVGVEGRPVPERHDTLSGALLISDLVRRGMQRRTASALAAAIAGHHGTLRSIDHLEQAQRLSIAQSPGWHATQRALLDELAESFLSAAPVPEVREPSAAHVLALAGLISVADWIGSDVRRFPVEVREPMASAGLAAHTVPRKNWSLPAVGIAAARFDDVFAAPDGTPRPPRASQQAVIDLLRASDAEPRLIVIEDRTGSGKTEAALWVVRHELLAGARGFYVALPTRATAGQFHRRAAAFAERLWPGEQVAPRLLHSTADLEVAPAPTVVDGEGQTAEAEAAEAESWFSGRRRGLLAAAGVGTVDQMLLAVLREKHHFVRLWGLQGKVVVIDEAHAYDQYTGALLERAVSWLAALDCTVVILSATLPASSRRSLADAFRMGLRGSAAPKPSLAAWGRSAEPSGESVATVAPDWAAPYPRLLSATKSATTVRSIVDPRPPRRFAIRALNLTRGDGDHRQLVEAVGRAVADGGCVAVVCNTVDAAQRRFRALRETLSRGTEVVLLHSRLRACERELVERRLLTALGPPDDPAVSRPEALVVVATQIIEQSLDFDFDAMFSDLAPVDLLIQRAGRLHRHAREEPRPPAHQRPALVVVDTEGASAAREHLRSSDLIYTPAVLHRTRVVLRDRESIEEPRDLDALVEGVYGEPVPPGATKSESDAIRAADQAAIDESRKRREHADVVSLAAPNEPTPPWDLELRALPDAEGSVLANFAATTRWSEQPSLSFVVLFPNELPGRARTSPGRAQVTELLRRSFSATSPALTRPLLQRYAADRAAGCPRSAFRPSAWTANSHLRDLILIELNEAGEAQPIVARDVEVQLPLRYDRTEGAILER